jgi:MOSC domain-containing protein YiiM
MSRGPEATVTAVHASPTHQLAKDPAGSIDLVAGIGVAGDAHRGPTVAHRSRVGGDEPKPNLRQIHLIGSELHDLVAEAGFEVGPGQTGENVTTTGIDLLALPTGTLLRLGGTALVSVTGLRNPCRQLDGLHPGLMAALMPRDADGAITRLAGVMAVVVEAGTVKPSDAVVAAFPPGPGSPLRPV